MEKKRMFYLLDSETGKTIPVEAVREEDRGQWKALCGSEKCKTSASRTLTINDKLNPHIFHCSKCGWKGNALKQPTINTDNGKKIFKNHWKSYLDIGLIPFPASRKKPIVEWKNETTDEPIQPTIEDYKEWENKYSNNNVWVLIGSHRIVLDPDGPLAENFVQSLNLPDCPISKSGGKSRHRFLKSSEPLEFLKVKFGENDFLEVRTGPVGIVVPPSIHPETDRAYQWEKDHSPWDIPSPEFPMEAYEKIKAKIPEPEMSKPCGENQESIFGRFDVDRYLTKHGIEYKVKQRGDKIFYLLRQCLFTSEHGHGDVPGDAAIVQGISEGRLGYHCFHNSCFDKTWKEARQAISREQPVVQFCEGYKPPLEKRDPENSKDFLPSLPSFNEIAQLNIRVEWAIDGIIPKEAISILTAPGGGLKTWLSLKMGCCVNEGCLFLGQTVQKMPAFYVDFENPLSLLSDRSRILGGSEMKVWHLSNPFPPPHLDSDNWISLKMLPPGLLIFDTLRSAQLLDENSSKDMALIMGRLKELREIGFTILLIHHSPKADDRKYKGSTAISDLADHCLVLERVRAVGSDEIADDQDDADLPLRLGVRGKTRFESTPIFLEFKDGVFSRADDPTQRLLSNMQSVLIDYYEENGNYPNQKQFIGAVKDPLGLSRKSIVNLLQKGRGKYWTFEKGQRNAWIYQPIQFFLSPRKTEKNSVFPLSGENSNAQLG